MWYSQNSRTRLPKTIQIVKACHLFPLFLEVTKQPCWSLPVNMIIILCTYPLATYITVPGVLTTMASSLLVSLPILRVSTVHQLWVDVWTNVQKLATHQQAKMACFRKFHWQLFHMSLSRILNILKPFMTHWDLVCCSDEYYRWVVYGLGPYIADYKE